MNSAKLKYESFTGTILQQPSMSMTNAHGVLYVDRENATFEKF